MKRKFNYTGRIKIPRKNIQISLNRSNDLIKSFDAQINIDNLKLPENAKVFIETYFKTELFRFDYGIVDKIEPKQDNDLTLLGYSENLKFRVIITDNTGLILAMAEGIRPVNDIESDCILPIKTEDLGYQLWQLDFSDIIEGPTLLLNNRINGIQNFAISDHQFIISVYPAVLKETLMRIIFIDGIHDPEDPSIEWHKKWLDFVKNTLNTENYPVLDTENADFEEDRTIEWINLAVENFCDSITSKNWQNFIRKMTGEGLI